MVCKETYKANGFGRAVSKDGELIFEGQFKDGELHGYVRGYRYRYRYYYDYEYFEYSNGKQIKKL